MGHNGKSKGAAGLTLSEEERALILKHGTLSEVLARKLLLGMRQGEQLVFHLHPNEIAQLMDCLAVEAVRARNPVGRRQLEELYKRIEQMTGPAQETPEAWIADPTQTPSTFNREAQQLLQSRSFPNLASANQALQQLSSEYNYRPQPELEGLSPVQVSRLIYSEWDKDESGVKLYKNLPLEMFKDSRLFCNAQILLQALRESHVAKATAAGNLNRKFVAQMVEAMRFEPGYVDQLRKYNKVINEEDVRPLHILRTVLEFGGLVRRRSAVFKATRKAEQFLDDRSAGELYTLLFLTYFQKLNLACLDRLPEYSGIQQTVAFSLYVVAKQARRWVGTKELESRLFLPAVKQEIMASRFSDYIGIAAYARVLRPLEKFGLLECEYKQKHNWHRELSRVRKTDLFRRFICFDLPNR